MAVVKGATDVKTTTTYVPGVGTINTKTGSVVSPTTSSSTTVKKASTPVTTGVIANLAKTTAIPTAVTNTQTAANKVVTPTQPNVVQTIPGTGGMTITTNPATATSKTTAPLQQAPITTSKEVATQNKETLKEAQTALAGGFGTGTFKNGQLSPQELARQQKQAAQDAGKQVTASQIVNAVQTGKITTDFKNNPVFAAGMPDEIAVDTPGQTIDVPGVGLIDAQGNVVQSDVEGTKTTAQQPAGNGTQQPNGIQTGAGTRQAGATAYDVTGSPNGAGVYGDTSVQASEFASSPSGNPYWDKLQTMSFDYNPATDQEYLDGSAVLENQVAQMMVGRGGLYSSVQQAALSAKLIEFQIAMRKQKYEQYVEDRNFMASMAKTVWDRQAQLFNQDMAMREYDLAVMKYNADREDAAFSKSMQQASLNLQRENQRLAQAKAQADYQAAQMTDNINSRVANVVLAKNNYEQMMAEWSKAGIASNRVASFFGVQPGTYYGRSYKAYISKFNSIQSEIDSIAQDAADVGALDIVQASLYDFINQPAATTYDVTQSKEDLTAGTKTTYSYKTTSKPA